jgi:hypothetical protein
VSTRRDVVGLGLRAQKGGAVIVALVVDRGEPRVLLSTLVATHNEGDRLSLEPYAVAAGMTRGPGGKASAEAVVAVEEGRGRQDQLAAKGLQDVVRRLEAEGHDKIVAALIVNRAGWVSDLLDYSLAWADHVPVAQGLAVREALRFGLDRCGIDRVELDEKSLTDLAQDALKLPLAEIGAHLKNLGATSGKPWRKEQKSACLAAWLAAVRPDLI